MSPELKKAGSKSKKATAQVGPAARPAVPRGSRKGTLAVDRRAAILDAALEEFSASGFAAARLEDVARRAGVAKGTIYLYFSDKEVLFQELIRAFLTPVIQSTGMAAMGRLPMREAAERLFRTFAAEIFNTRRKDVVRLVITEGQRFPKMAEFYFHEVVMPVMDTVRTLAQAAVARGELESDALARFPQLLGAPIIAAVMWDGLFSQWSKMEVDEFLDAYLDLLFPRGSS